jgi:hypothetical protein
MKRITDHTGILQTDSELITTILEKWQPQEFTLDERDYETDLFAHLRRSLLDVPMTTQHGLAKGRADIVIEDSHVIELKLGFTDVLEFDRCIGQLERYCQRWVKKDRGPVYLVIVGESDPDLRDMLHVWFKEANARFFSWSPFHLIEKMDLTSIQVTTAKEKASV